MTEEFLIVAWVVILIIALLYKPDQNHRHKF